MAQQTESHVKSLSNALASLIMVGRCYLSLKILFSMVFLSTKETEKPSDNANIEPFDNAVSKDIFVVGKSFNVQKKICYKPKSSRVKSRIGWNGRGACRCPRGISKSVGLSNGRFNVCTTQ